MRVSHIMFRVADMERSVAFYRDLVGLGVLTESSEFSFLDGGSIRLALNAVATVGDDASMTEVVFETEDVARDIAAMKSRGVPFEVEPRPVMGHGDRSLVAAHFHDPDGHLVSVTGWVDDEVG